MYILYCLIGILLIVFIVVMAIKVKAQKKLQQKTAHQVKKETAAPYDDGTFKIDENKVLRKYCGSDLNITVPGNAENVFGEKIFDTIYGVFENNHIIRNVIISEGVKTINTYAFKNCNMLNSLVLPNSLKSICMQAFEGCISLSTIIFSKSIPFIGDNAFKGCENISKISINDIDTWYNASFAISIRSPFTNDPDHHGFTLEYFGPFRSCYDLYVEQNLVETLCPPANVSGINKGVFSRCRSLKSLNCENIEFIAAVAFEGCCNLKQLHFGNKLKSIGEMAFMNCECLEEIDLPRNITVIGDKAFYGCEKLKKVRIHADYKNRIKDIFSSTSLKFIDSRPVVLYDDVEFEFYD